MPPRAAPRRRAKELRNVEQTVRPRAVNSRILGATVIGALFIAGTITRVYLLNRSLSLDEAWLANAITSPSLHDAIYYRDWLQTTPPMFLVMPGLSQRQDHHHSGGALYSEPNRLSHDRKLAAQLFNVCSVLPIANSELI